jgi:hypothetical protein
VASKSGKLTVQELRDLVGSGQLDTVLVAITDMQGRLQGKRCSGRYFVEEVLAHGTEGCNYLLAVDVDMNTVEGYEMSSWDSGYGDLLMAPDLDTLRLLPWHEATALVLCDVQWLDGRRCPPRRGRSSARSSTGSPSAAWRRTWDRAGVHRLRRHLRGRLGQGVPRSASRPTSTTWTTPCSAPPGSSRCCATSATR